MAKFPYGGFDADPESKNDDSWTRLRTIAEHLEAGEKIPSFLAMWLGEAIFRSNNDRNEFLCLLGLTKRRGRQPADLEVRITLGLRVCELESSGYSPEQAITQVLSELVKTNDDGGGISRSTLQNYRDQCREAQKVDWE